MNPSKQTGRFRGVVSERVEDKYNPPAYDVDRGAFEGDYVFIRYVEGTRSLTSDNAMAISHTLRTLADAIGASEGFNLGRAQVFVVIEKNKPPPGPPELSVSAANAADTVKELVTILRAKTKKKKRGKK